MRGLKGTGSTAIRTVGTEARDELAEIRADLIRIQSQARVDGDWKKELSVLDRRLKLVELRVRELHDYSTNVLSVNFDVSAETAEQMSTAFLARQRMLRLNGEKDE